MKDAICDLRYLLERGYRRTTAVKVVGDRYRLSREERNLLLRCVYPRAEAEMHRKKLLTPAEVKGQTLVVDGYNVLITVESWLRGKPCIACDDGFVRDVSGVYGKHRHTGVTDTALEGIFQALGELSPARVRFIFDSMVSFSGMLCSCINGRAREVDLDIEARTSRTPDAELVANRGIICTSDMAIIARVPRVFDLAGYVIPADYLLHLPECKDLYELRF
ncbi:DUF434 domain-containing protein [Candidatus Pyrohabitans sp.]